MPKKINSKKKGSRGELDLSKELMRLFGKPARRGQQYQGGSDSPDVVWDKRISIECKRVNRLNINEAMKQSSDDSAPNQIPTVFHRADHKPWLVTIKLEDLKAFAEIIYEIINRGESSETNVSSDSGWDANGSPL